jgi:hypothetical protein
LVETSAPDLGRRIRVARSDVHVEVGNMVSEHEGVDVVSAHHFL